MENLKEYIAKFESVADFDLYVTENRFIFIKSNNPQYASVGGGGLLGGLISEGIFAFQKNKAEKKQKELKEMSLDELLTNIKHSFAVPYNEVEHVILGKSFSGGQLNLKSKKLWKFLNLNKEQFKKLSDLLPSIQSLKEKTKIVN